MPADDPQRPVSAFPTPPGPTGPDGSRYDPERRRHLSGLLQDIMDESADNSTRIAVGDLLDRFGNRAFGALIFIFAFPNVLPIAIPGFSTLLAAPLLLLTWQLMRGHSQPWLPAVMRERSINRADFTMLIQRAMPTIRRVEKMVGPRLMFVTDPLGERLIGLLALILATVLFLPIPLGNMIPGFAIALLALGVLEKDGAAVLLGAVVGVIGLFVVSGVVYTLFKAAVFVLRNAFGV